MKVSMESMQFHSCELIDFNNDIENSTKYIKMKFFNNRL